MTDTDRPQSIWSRRKIHICAGLIGAAAPLIDYLVSTPLLEMDQRSWLPLIGDLLTFFWFPPILLLVGVTNLAMALPYVMGFNAGLYIALTSLYFHIRNHGARFLTVLPFIMVGLYWLLLLSLTLHSLFTRL